MKNYTILLLLLLLALISCSEDSSSAEEEAPEIDITNTGLQSVMIDGVRRSFVLHYPNNLPPNPPLVFLMHGYGESAQESYYRPLNDLASEKGFVVVYPQGLPDRSGVAHWNAGLSISEVDDVNHLSELALRMQQQLGLDPNRTYATGISNGGFMSYHLAANRPDIFKGVVSLIGTMSGATWQARERFQPVPVLQLSGALDQVVPIDGSMTALGGWGGAPDMNTIVDFLVDLNQCQQADTLQINEHTQAFRYSNGTNGNQVWYYLIDNMAHDVPIGLNGTLNSYDLLWEFLSAIE